MSKSTNLTTILQDRLDKIDGAKVLTLSTFDGVDLLTISSKTDSKSGSRNSEDINNIISISSPIYSQMAETISKLEYGSPRYSITWVDYGILVQCKLEAATLSIYLDESANLGMMEEQLEIIVRILLPFTNENFIDSNR